MPASSSSSTSCHRLAFCCPGVLVWASSSTSTTSGRRASTASTSSSANCLPRYVDEARRDQLDAVEQLGGLACGRGFPRPRRRRRCRARAGGAPRRASRRSCRRPAPRPGRCAAHPRLAVLRDAARVLDSPAHHPPGYCWSSARLSSSTLTAGSPMKPRSRPSVWAAMTVADLIGADAAGLGDAVDLQVGVGGGDVGVQPAAAGGHRVGGHRGVGRAPRRGSARSGRSSSPRRTWRTRPARPRRWRGTGPWWSSHGSLTLTTRVGCGDAGRAASRGPITDSTAPTPPPVQNGRAPSTPSSFGDVARCACTPG